MLFHCDLSYIITIKINISLSTIVLNGRDQPKNNGAHNLRTSKTHVRIQITQKHCLKCIGTTIITLYLSECQ